MIRSARLALAAALAILAPAANAEAPPKTVSIGGASFVDSLGFLSPRRWFTSHGWSNGAHQDCVWSRGNVRIVDDALTLSLDEALPAETKDVKRKYACAEVQTRELYGYGTYEVRMRAAAGPGLVSAFFTFSGPQQNANRPHDEIDIEHIGKNPRLVQLNHFASGKSAKGFDADIGVDGTASAVDYAFEWLPDTIRWYVNGRLVHEADRAKGAAIPSHPGKICLSLWNGAGEGMRAWLGTFSYPGRPLTARFERVAFTRRGDPCQFPESIVCKRGRLP